MLSLHGAGFPPITGALALYFCFFLRFSGVFISHAVPHHAGRPSPHAAETGTCLLFWWHLPCSGYRPQLLFPFIPKEEQRLSLLVSAFIVSRSPASPVVGDERYSICQGTLPCIKWWRWKEMPDSDSCLFLQLSVQPRRFE